MKNKIVKHINNSKKAKMERKIRRAYINCNLPIGGRDFLSHLRFSRILKNGWED